MRIASAGLVARPWSRYPKVMNASLLEAEVPEGGFSFLSKLYKKVLNPEDRRRTSVRISTGTEVRLGGTVPGCDGSSN